ncbi:MAG: membrane or secreted protein [Planctomycetes bacterium]|nr:membrane or secreted protein [Planctomycetota bacterium]
MARSCFSLLAAILVMGSVGCKSVSPPDWFHPGPAASQQSRAERYDPYPENEPGPTIVGARPREYQKPPAEPSRARWVPWSWLYR